MWLYTELQENDCSLCDKKMTEEWEEEDCAIFENVLR
jgi:hypothetical protein